MTHASGKVDLSSLEIRYTEMGDAPYLSQWLADPSVEKCFPVHGAAEVEDATQRWIGFSRYNCSLTAVFDGKPCGMATLYLQPYRKLAHQCEFGIVVSHFHRGQGIGKELLRNLLHLGKTQFHLEMMHLQVNSTNVNAIKLYKSFGFVEFGSQSNWIKEVDGTYTGRSFMEKFI